MTGGFWLCGNKVNELDLKRIIDLNKKVKELVAKDKIGNVTIRFRQDKLMPDLIKHSFTADIVKKALSDGLHLEDKDLYEDPNEKHPKKNYYCIHENKNTLFYVKYILVSYYLFSTNIETFHICPMNKNSREGRKYSEIKNQLEDFSLEKA